VKARWGRAMGMGIMGIMVEVSPAKAVRGWGQGMGRGAWRGHG